MSDMVHLIKDSPEAVGLALGAVIAALVIFAVIAYRRSRALYRPAAGRDGDAALGGAVRRTLSGIGRTIGLPAGRKTGASRVDTDAVFENIAIWGDETRPLSERHRALDEARTRLNRLADSILASHASAPAARRPDPDTEGALSTPLAEILLVDDEATLRDLTALSLREMGFIVHRADNAEEAMEIIRGRAAHIDMVLSDVIMPGASGPDLAQRIASMHPDIPVVFMSGYEQRRLAKERLIPPAMRCLSKPFTLEELLSTIKEVMASRRHDVVKP